MQQQARFWALTGPCDRPVTVGGHPHETAPASSLAQGRTDSTDGGREMNASHSINASAVVTRLHDVGRSTEKSGAAVNGRGCVRGAGRQHTSFMTVVDAGSGGSSYGEGSGERQAPARSEDAEAAFT